MTDRTKPPEHYSVTFIGGHDYGSHDYWAAVAHVGGHDIGGTDVSADAATDSCWRHYDAVTAPLRAEVERLTAKLDACYRLLDAHIGEPRP